MRYIIYLGFFSLIFSCVPPSEKDDLAIEIDYEIEEQRLIIEAKDNRDVASIATSLSAEDHTLRFLATEACASIQDAAHVPKLFEILNTDVHPEIREMAAYSIGQTYDAQWTSQLISAFRSQDTSDYNSPIRGAILEAVGKCGDEKMLSFIGSVKAYDKTMTHLLLGQVRSIYRFGLRGIYHDEGTKTMLRYVLDEGYPEEVRLVAAQYLARNPSIDLGDSIMQLVQAMDRTSNVNIEMSLARAISSRGDERISDYLLGKLSREDDYRVTTNILRGISSYDYSVYRDTIVQLLDHENEHIFELSANLLKEQVVRQDASFFLEKAKNTDDHYRRAHLLMISLNALPSGFVNTRNITLGFIKEGLKAAVTDRDRAPYIKGLALDPAALPDFFASGLGATSNYLRNAAITSIPELINNQRSQAIYRRPSQKKILVEAIFSELSKILQTGDSGSIAAVAGVIGDESCGFIEIPAINITLRSAMRTLKMPEGYEAKQACLNTLEYLEDTTYTLAPLAIDHPINWEVLSPLSDSSRAFIITTKGQIEISFFKNNAPGSVANFVQLSQDNFFDGKTIHRIVPNFVIQGGCPRGDGYGSLDYTIRSELGPLYYNREGYVGMASAGNDTEGTQWFITHSPTPHLDGRYTIFGKVTSGMDVVHKIRPGDLVQDVRILKI